MSVVNLRKRKTNEDPTEYFTHWKSPVSKIYIDQENPTNPSSLDIEVGAKYIYPGSNHCFKIPEDGLNIRPHQTVVVFSRQRFMLPLNMFGIVTGKGKYIYQGCLVSTGKIDPGFDGTLKIGFHNGGSLPIKLMPGESFATAFFLNTEETLDAPLRHYPHELNPDVKKMSWLQKTGIYVKSHWIGFLAWAFIAIPTFLLYITQFIEIIKQWLSPK